MPIAGWQNKKILRPDPGPALLPETVIPILAPEPESPFPPVDQALENPQGLLAAGGDLSPARLLNAYRHGIFPWYSEGQPILWWSPEPRCILHPQDVHISRRLRRTYNQGHFALSADQAFAQVIGACAGPRQNQDGTWINAEMQAAFIRLHKRGIAHSVEVWTDGELAGGIYGLALGRVFCGESMFSKYEDASKVALVALCKQLHRWGFSLLDCQISNPHLINMGAVEITRSEFQQYLKNTAPPDQWRKNFSCPARW
jgi:leucyl/phenylalanyl-tRNA--protein transferase